MTDRLVAALLQREQPLEVNHVGRVESASSARVMVSGIGPEPLSCRCSDEFRVLVDSGKATGRQVFVSLASGQPYIAFAIDEEVGA